MPIDDSRARHLNPRRTARVKLRWLLLAVVYIILFVTLALATLRNGHYLLFWVKIISPGLWIIGALVGPTPRAEARGAA